MTAVCDCRNVKSGAHFHYDIVDLKGVEIALRNMTRCKCTKCSTDGEHDEIQLVEMDIEVNMRSGARCELKRTFADLRLLDYHLHECAFGRPFSRLTNLTKLSKNSLDETLRATLNDYVNRLSVILSDRITCCSLFEFLELESHGLKKQSRLGGIVEDELNVPALCAARCVQAHEATDSDELALCVGDLVAVVDMPSTDESIWWKGKSMARAAEDSFKVGYFPYYCVLLFPTHTTTTSSCSSPGVCDAAVQPVSAQGTSPVSVPARPNTASVPLKKSAAPRKKSVLLKRGKLSALLRAFLVTRPSRNALKQRGLLRDRVYGSDLSEYLLRIGRATPPILDLCTEVLESTGVQPGIYRLSGSQSVVHRLRARLDDDDYLATKLGQRAALTASPNKQETPSSANSSGVIDVDAEAVETSICPPWYEDAYSLASVLRMYFRELPIPLFTFDLYDELLAMLGPIDALRSRIDAQPNTEMDDEAMELVQRARHTLMKLPRSHYRTARALFTHLQRMARLEARTNMGARNLAIVWSPNLLLRRSFVRTKPAAISPRLRKVRPESIRAPQDALREARDATAITEFAIRYAHLLFDDGKTSILSGDSVPTSAQPAAIPLNSQRPRRLGLLDLTDAIRRQYPDAAARDRLLGQRYDALLNQYGVSHSPADSEPPNGAEHFDPKGVSTSALISLPAAVRHDFKKELAAIERDCNERGLRVDDFAARRRCTSHSTNSASSFWKSLLAGASGRNRDTARPRSKLRKCESGTSLSAGSGADDRSSAALSNRRSSRLSQSERHAQEKNTQRVDPPSASRRAVDDDSTETPPKRALHRQSQMQDDCQQYAASNESPVYVKGSLRPNVLPLSRSYEAMLDSPPREPYVELEREPSARRNVLPQIPIIALQQETDFEVASCTDTLDAVCEAGIIIHKPCTSVSASTEQLISTMYCMSDALEDEHHYENVGCENHSAPGTLERRKHATTSEPESTDLPTSCPEAACDEDNGFFSVRVRLKVDQSGEDKLGIPNAEETPSVFFADEQTDGQLPLETIDEQLENRMSQPTSLELAKDADYKQPVLITLRRGPLQKIEANCDVSQTESSETSSIKVVQTDSANTSVSLDSTLSLANANRVSQLASLFDRNFAVQSTKPNLANRLSKTRSLVEESESAALVSTSPTLCTHVDAALTHHPHLKTEGADENNPRFRVSAAKCASVNSNLDDSRTSERTADELAALIGIRQRIAAFESLACTSSSRPPSETTRARTRVRDTVL